MSNHLSRPLPLGRSLLRSHRSLPGALLERTRNLRLRYLHPPPIVECDLVSGLHHHAVVFVFPEVIQHASPASVVVVAVGTLGRKVGMAAQVVQRVARPDGALGVAVGAHFELRLALFVAGMLCRVMQFHDMLLSKGLGAGWTRERPFARVVASGVVAELLCRGMRLAAYLALEAGACLPVVVRLEVSLEARPCCRRSDRAALPAAVEGIVQGALVELLEVVVLHVLGQALGCAAVLAAAGPEAYCRILDGVAHGGGGAVSV